VESPTVVVVHAGNVFETRVVCTEMGRGGSTETSKRLVVVCVVISMILYLRYKMEDAVGDSEGLLQSLRPNGVVRYLKQPVKQVRESS
jgi:hypothetical protein